MRDAHHEVAREIAAGARADPVAIEAESVALAHDLVERRPDCFGTSEQEEVRDLYRLYGPEA